MDYWQLCESSALRDVLGAAQFDIPAETPLDPVCSDRYAEAVLPESLNAASLIDLQFPDGGSVFGLSPFSLPSPSPAPFPTPSFPDDVRPAAHVLGVSDALSGAVGVGGGGGGGVALPAGYNAFGPTLPGAGDTPAPGEDRGPEPGAPPRGLPGGGGGGGADWSGFCHICSRSVRRRRAARCTNRSRPGACRKVVCERCLPAAGADLSALGAAAATWQCCHCRRRCPAHAQCATYTRTNRRLRQLRLRARRAAPTPPARAARSGRSQEEKYPRTLEDERDGQRRIGVEIG